MGGSQSGREARSESTFQKRDKMSKDHRICLATLAAAAGLLWAGTPSAVAWGLSDEDYDYLRKTQLLERYDAPIPQLGPKERTRLHNLITDPETANDPSARDKNVKDAIAVFLSHQVWEKAHPGKLWDAPNSTFPN
jgi:hypothetical protein